MESLLNDLNDRVDKKFELLADTVATMTKTLAALQGEKRDRDEASGSGGGSAGSQPAKKAKRTAESDSDEGELVDDDAISIPGDDDDLLASLDAELSDEDDTGDAVVASVAKSVNKRFSKALSEQKLKAKLEKFPRPSNCEKLIVPTVNPEIWKKLNNKFAKKADLRAAGLQRALTKAAVAITRSTHLMVKSKTAQSASERAKTNEGIDQNVDALTLLGHAHRQVSLNRRTALRRHLGPSIRALCDESVPITGYLFGDDLPASLKEAKELDKIEMASTENSRGAMGNRSSGSFLGRNNRWKQNQYKNKNNQQGGKKFPFKKKYHNQSGKQSQSQ